MIDESKLEKPYEQITIRSKVWCICDYCGKEFQREKKSRERLNVNVTKDSCGIGECRKKKQEDVCLQLYGEKTIFKAKAFEEKQKATCLEKFGTETYFDSEDFQQKRKETLLEKYGVENPLQSEEVRKKHAKTCLERYGVENPSQTDDFADKIKTTSQERYNVDHVSQIPGMSDRRKETTREKYGVDYYTQTEEYWEKRIATCQERYGVDHPSQVKENRDKWRSTMKERYGTEYYTQTEEFKKDYYDLCMKRYGVPNPLCLQENRAYGKTQNEIQEWLNSFGCEFQTDHTVLEGKELDMYDKNLNLAIEYCGLYWHNEITGNKDKNYHYKKYSDCEKKGIKLLTIFEDEWKKRQNQVKGVLKAAIGKCENKIQARKCKTKILEKQEFCLFCDLNHILSSSQLGLFYAGLEHDGEIMGGMSLGRHHRLKDILTIDRLCFKHDCRIVGGASKLLSAGLEWASKNNYKEIITWSDNRWSNGKVYETLGFELEDELGPDYSYVHLDRPGTRLSKQSQKKENTDCPKDITELQWATQHGLARIWDCGKKRWKYII